MVGSIYACFYLLMLPDATECRAECRQVSHPRKSQMTVLMRPHCANACFFPHGRSASGTYPDTLAYHKLLWQAHTIRHPAVCYRPLHLAHGYHLLPQVVLVLANATIPPSDCPVLTNQDIFRNLIEQSAGMLAKSVDLVEGVVSLPEVVRDHDNTARKCIDGVS
jgi:hypothetical protein